MRRSSQLGSKGIRVEYKMVLQYISLHNFHARCDWPSFCLVASRIGPKPPKVRLSAILLQSTKSRQDILKSRRSKTICAWNDYNDR
jgi:hypothetical protein